VLLAATDFRAEIRATLGIRGKTSSFGAGEAGRAADPLDIEAKGSILRAAGVWTSTPSGTRDVSAWNHKACAANMWT
jgi:hypothetical protein